MTVEPKRVVFAGLVASTVLVVASLVMASHAGASHARGMAAMSIDLDISGNAATSLGPLDDCIEVSPGDTVTMDVTAEGIPQSNPMLGFSFALNYPSVVIVESADSSFLLASAPGSSLFSDTNEPTPDADGLWVGSAVDLADDGSANESGSGVLERLTLSIDLLAATGVYPLTLTNAAHVDPNNVANLPDVLRFAHLAVGATCDGLPTQPPTPPPPSVTPTPFQTPTPTPPPTTPTATTLVGIDHNGSVADVNTGPANFVANGGYVTVSLVVDSLTTIGEWRYVIEFDDSKLTPTGCLAAPGSVCVEDFMPGTVASAGDPFGGLPAPGVMATVTFRAANGEVGCTELTVKGGMLTDITGEVLVEREDLSGSVCAVGGTPPPATPEPSPPPTPGPDAQVVRVGIDHNGGVPDINPGPAMPGNGSFQVDPVLESEPGTVWSWEIELRFDPTLVKLDNCFLVVNASTCLVDGTGAGWMTAGVSTGLPSAQRLAFFGLSNNYATNPFGHCGEITVTVRAVYGPGGEPLASDTSNGIVCLSGQAITPQPSPGPTVTICACVPITATPTPAALPEAGGDDRGPVGSPAAVVVGTLAIVAGCGAAARLARDRRQPR